MSNSESNLKNRGHCHICNQWTPEGGCTHYLPDSETVLKLGGYTVNYSNSKVICKKDGIVHRFESVAKAARILIHEKKTVCN